jgi:S-adenosylmethionine synthetase
MTSVMLTLRMVKEKSFKSKKDVPSSGEDMKVMLVHTLLNFGECELSESVKTAI